MAREPGHRTKVSVYSREEKVDPVGSMVGQRGTRVMAVTNELGNEKIDIIEWAEEPDKFIANAFSPAKVISVEILPRREARVFVAEDQLSLALGKGGENVRLAAKLTGFKIDVRSQSRPEEIQKEEWLMPRISRRKKPKKRNNCVRKKINHHCISHNSCLELRNAHFANSERISF